MRSGNVANGIDQSKDHQPESESDPDMSNTTVRNAVDDYCARSSEHQRKRTETFSHKLFQWMLIG